MKQLRPFSPVPLFTSKNLLKTALFEAAFDTAIALFFFSVVSVVRVFVFCYHFGCFFGSLDV